MNPIFVYGILKGRHDAKTGHVNLHRLIDMGAFPAAVPADAEHSIKGELIYVDHDTVQEFDRIEGAPNFYNREEVEVTLDDGEKTTAEMYVVNSTYWENDSVISNRLAIEESDSKKIYEYNLGR